MLRRIGWSLVAATLVGLGQPARAQEVETKLYGWNDSSADGWSLPRGVGFSTTPAPIPEGAGCLAIDVPGVSWDQGVRVWEVNAPPQLFQNRTLRLDIHLDASFAGSWFWLRPVFTSAADGWYALDHRAIHWRGAWQTVEWEYDPSRIDPAGFQLILVTQTDAQTFLYVDHLRTVDPGAHVLVDQFGHRPSAPKNVIFTADPGNGFLVKRTGDDQVAFRVPQDGGGVVPWQGGAVDDVSGDRVWHGDFSALTAAGTYYIDSAVGRSVAFEIRDDLYDDLAVQAARSLYFDRCGVALTSGGPWTHAACHVGAGQDREALTYVAGQALGPAVDVSGGWHHGGGDYAKYVTHLGEILWFVMRAYETRPALFADGSGAIPESGNGAPDLLDELAVELRWLLKMQRADGSVRHKVSGLRWYDAASPPEAFGGPRYVTEISTRATAIFTGLCARAARLYYPVDSVLASRLQWAAQRAWTFLEEHPDQIPAGGFRNSGEMTSLEASGGALEDAVARMFAAVELFRLTRNGEYRNYFDTRWDLMLGGGGPADRAHPDEHFLLTLTVIDYLDSRPGNSSFFREVEQVLRSSADRILQRSDAYRSPMDADDYRFASNRLKVQWATVLLEAARLGVSPASELYRARAFDYLHYIHGRNPLGKAYLTNAAPWGAENPVLQPFHHWFPDGHPLYDGASSTYGPAPMMMVSGPNDFYNGTLSPPLGQPPSRAYVDMNTHVSEWVERTWEFNEPAIGRTAAYVYLVTALASRTAAR